MKYQLKQSLATWRADTGALRVGISAPRAVEIDDPPEYLETMLSILSEPVSPGEMVARLLEEHPEVNRDEIRRAFFDLLRLRLVHQHLPAERYHRHQLYFDFFDVEPRAYENLVYRRVGLIGTGGIGSTCAMLLAAAGVGELVCSDGDVVEESNLTRTVLFEESDIGERKVEAARARLTARNRDVLVRSVVERFGEKGPDLLREYFADCDAWILSADSPDVHAWTSQVAGELGIPYIHAGYSEILGVVGPLIVPGVTACFRCEVLEGREQTDPLNQLNRSFQAPSYGPLNALVSSIAVNEVLRSLLGLDCRTRGQRLLIDSADYSVSFWPFEPSQSCDCGAYDVVRAARFRELADNYEQHREHSLNSLVLDDLVADMVDSGAHLHVLDVGCGTGTLSRELVRRGHFVTALDTSPDMLAQLRGRLSESEAERVTVIEGDACDAPWRGTFDRILLNLVLDHIADPGPLLRRLVASLSAAGEIVVVLPHPMKDAARWRKELVAGEWTYPHMIIDDYFREGPIVKSREDDRGNVVVGGLTSYRRTIETYFGMLLEAGLRVEELLEPRASEEHADPRSTNYAKASRIPYFLVLRCARSHAAAEEVDRARDN